MLGNDAQQCSTLEDIETMVTEVGQPLVAIGHRGRIDHERALRVTAVVGNKGRVLVKVDVDTLLTQRVS